MKRSYLVIVAIIIIVLVGFAVWFSVFNKSAGLSGSSGSTGSLPSVGLGNTGGPGANAGGNGSGGSGAGSSMGQGLPVANGPTKFGVVSSEAVLAYFVDGQNNVSIVEPTGKIALIAAGSGQPNFLSSTDIQNVLSAGFSFDGKKAFVNFGDPINPQTSIFDMTSKAWTPLSTGAISPAWSPSDSRLAYLKNGPAGSISLVTLDVSRTSNKPVILGNFVLQDLTVIWPIKNTIVLADKPSIYAEGNAWSFDLQKKTLTQAISPSFGLETAWSATTSSMALAYSTAIDGVNGGLSLINPASGNSQNFTFLTLPSKCVFNSEFAASSSAVTATSTPLKAVYAVPKTYLALYCAVPNDRAQFSIAQLPDDYEQMAVFTADNFYRIHTDTGVIDLVYTPAVSVDATTPKIFGKTLFFINRYDNRLYAILLS